MSPYIKIHHIQHITMGNTTSISFKPSELRYMVMSPRWHIYLHQLRENLILTSPPPPQKKTHLNLSFHLQFSTLLLEVYDRTPFLNLLHVSHQTPFPCSFQLRNFLRIPVSISFSVPLLFIMKLNFCQKESLQKLRAIIFTSLFPEFRSKSAKFHSCDEC
jgi:hypothetical protein